MTAEHDCMAPEYRPICTSANVAANATPAIPASVLAWSCRSILAANRMMEIEAATMAAAQPCNSCSNAAAGHTEKTTGPQGMPYAFLAAPNCRIRRPCRSLLGGQGLERFEHQ